MSDPDDLSRFSGSVFFIDVRPRPHKHCSSVRPAFDVWSRTFSFALSPEIHYVARSECVKDLFLAPDALLRHSSLRALSNAFLAVSVPCRCSRKLGSGVSLPLSKNDWSQFGNRPCAHWAREKPRTHSISLCANTPASSTPVDFRSGLSPARCSSSCLPKFQ